MDYRILALQRLSGGVELLSAVVLLIGFAKGMWGFLWQEWAEMRRQTAGAATNLAALRAQLGHYILLGLDFYIVADVLSSMLRPAWQELVTLVIIGLLRTLIGYFLGKELAETQV